ncbi:MAG TPA: D-alanyl-D-alanine carboxypeptidase [Solirubrobacteraceae bacterium]|nr:D-alanyl-D-alanine carboxypeptidase [Solirubrobacteraceae bacterium]
MSWVRRSLALVALSGGILGAPGAGFAASPLASLDKTLHKQITAAGHASGAYVVDLNTGQALFSYSSIIGRLPASVEKLYTTSTALLRYGPQARLTTTVLGTGSKDAAGVWHGTLYLKGGGDPTFGWAGFDRANYGGKGATIQRLVTNLIHSTGITAVQGSIDADASYFDTHKGTPATGYAASSEVEGQLDGVEFDRGWATFNGSSFQARPTLFAAKQFATALRMAHVRILHGTRIAAGRTQAGARTLAAIQGPTVATLIQMTNTPSDNYLAETLLKDLGARFGGAGTTAAGVSVVRSEIGSQFGIYPRFNDGSGLSYYDSTSPQQVVTLLQHMASNPFFTNSLAIAGQTGTLQSVDRGTIAQGRCRGKTGTLAAVANVAGYCQARDGHTLAFAFLVNGNTATNYVHDVLEARMMKAVAGYDG